MVVVLKNLKYPTSQRECMLLPFAVALQEVFAALPLMFIFVFVALGVGIVYLLVNKKLVAAVSLFNTLLLLLIILILILPK
jgi:hypothetical protein